MDSLIFTGKQMSAVKRYDKGRKIALIS